jgi:transcriptional regulator
MELGYLNDSVYLTVSLTINWEFILYVPKFNEEKDVSILHSLVKSKPLGAWTTIAGGEIAINHIPFILHEGRGELGTLVGHVARSNSIFKEFSSEIDSVVVFQGDQAYITPSWYPSKHKHGKAVPTWNYVVVHAHGIPKKIEDPEWLLQHLNELTDIHESEQKLPWKVSDAPDEFIEKLVGAIVGIEIPITKLTGKWKLGQNRPDPDKLGTIAGLMSSDGSESHGLANLLNQHVLSSDKG